MNTRSRGLAGATAAWGMVLASGCYVGLQGDGEDPPPSGESWDAASSEGGGDDGTDDGGPAGACAQTEVGATPLQRLTRSEYDNTVADLLGITGHPAAALPPDGSSGLFANNGEAAVSNYAVEVYRDLAESLAASADIDTLLPCDPAAIGEAACARAFVTTFGRRAYRRPLDDAQVERLMELFERGRTDGSFADGIALTIEAMLQSPSFLYRVEAGDRDLVELDGYEIASRLSYFLWRSMPDDALLDAADAGELDDDAGIEAHARRMLEDERAERAVLTFFGDLYALDTATAVYKDPELFPAFSAELAQDMRTELELFVLSTLRDGDHRLESLLAADHTFVNARLAAFYGIAAPPGDDFVRVELTGDAAQGLLAKPLLMALSAHDQRTSPTRRGKLVRTRVLCQGLPPPPPGVESAVPSPGTLSTRAWVQQRLDDPSCEGCHKLMDPIGLAFEHFDASGHYRELEDGLAIDASGTLVDTDVDGEFEGPSGLVAKLVQSEQVGECFAAQWFEFGLGRAPDSDDTCTTTDIAAAFADSDHDLDALVFAIATSDALRLRRPTQLEDSP